MGVAAQVDSRIRYEKTKDLGRMLTHFTLNEAIRNGSQNTNILDVLPARTATNLRYDKGAKEAVAWNEGGEETKIDLPLEDGWHVPDGNPFAIPNGRQSNRDDPDALYLVRHQDRSFNGPLGRGGWGGGYGWRFVGAGGGWSDDSGVALIGREATAPLVVVPGEELVKATDPKTLLQRAGQLDAVVIELIERLHNPGAQDYERLIKPIVDEAEFLRELARKLKSIQPKA